MPCGFPHQHRHFYFETQGNSQSRDGAEESAFGLSDCRNWPIQLSALTLSHLLMSLPTGASATGLLSGHISVTCQILGASFTPGDRNKLQLQWLHLPPQREQPVGQEWRHCTASHKCGTLSSPACPSFTAGREGVMVSLVVDMEAQGRWHFS